MAKSPRENKPASSGQPAWAALTWDDLENWAGGRSVQRGRSYQRSGHVKDLRVSADGALLATVIGTYRYATTVALRSGEKHPSFESACTCPIGGSCKHAVAVVAQYLEAIAKSQPVPSASEDDPRWTDLENAETTGGPWYDGGGDDEDEEEDEDEDEEEEEPAPRSRSRAPAERPAAGADADAKIERDIRGRSQAELADLVCSLIRRFPELRREFHERLALQQGNVKQLTGEVRKQIRKVTSQPGWSNHWSDEGHTPDYTPIRQRLERMLELGHADEVVALGRELIEQGLQQISESNDEGETAEAFRECLPVVFQALAKSRLTGPERLLFVIDAILGDDYDTFSDVSDAVLDAGKPADWSVVADTLAQRLKAEPARGDSADSFMRNYKRDSITNWLSTALENAGREAELGAIYEREARTTGSYERLVAFLLDRGRTDDAERWAKEGIAATREKLPGIASHLAGKLCDVARQRKQWDVVAAHAADEFFARPSGHTFDELIKAARKAKVEEPVRAAALQFLETGTQPYRLSAPKPAAPLKRTKSAGGKSAPKAQQPEPAEPQLVLDPKWPLPIPDYLHPVPKPQSLYDPGPRPHLDVLLEMAIAAKRPDDVLHWFDKMRAQKQPSGFGYGYSYASAYAERVAEAVADAYPERALDVYRAGLDAQLPRADQNAYAAAAGYLRKLRPIYEALGRLAEWTALVTSIREKYRNRPRFMEQLDALDGRTIVDSVRKARK